MKKEANKYRRQIAIGVAVGALALIIFIALAVSAWANNAKAMPENGIAWPHQKPATSAPEVIVYASDLTEDNLYEFDFWKDAASPGGKMIGTPNTGDELDPPPENDPNVKFKVKVQSGVPYRCWIHMKVGAPKGKSQANVIWVQFSDAVDKANKQILKPGTSSYLTAQGPAQLGWAWVQCNFAESNAVASLISFRTSGEVTVRLQAGMEGVGFDQLVLSPGRFLENAPSEAIVKK